MKYLVLTFITFSFLQLFAQTEGTILYTETVEFNLEAPEGMEEMFKNMPKSRSSNKTLIYKDGVSHYKIDNREDFEMENTADAHGGEGVFRIKIREPNEEVYSDHNTGKVVELADLMGKAFLIKDDLKKYNWKVTSERRQILDYQCMKATAMEDSTSITAWFAPEVPIGIGPNNYNGLPGAILMVDVDNGARQLIAKKVDFEPIDHTQLVKPTKGKKVNRSQFHKIEADKMAEQQAINGGNGVRMIIREN